MAQLVHVICQLAAHLKNYFYLEFIATKRSESRSCNNFQSKQSSVAQKKRESQSPPNDIKCIKKSSFFSLFCILWKNETCWTCAMVFSLLCMKQFISLHLFLTRVYSWFLWKKNIYLFLRYLFGSHRIIFN